MTLRPRPLRPGKTRAPVSAPLPARKARSAPLPAADKTRALERWENEGGEIPLVHPSPATRPPERRTGA